MSVADDPDKRDGFLTRWSRRKRELADEVQSVPPPQPATGLVPEAVEEDFDLSLLPDVETITAESDITLFFKKGVPEALKNAAMRKMWTADVSIRDFVAPADFQWDFNAPNGVPGFGPLEADFDLEAMLRQAIGEKAPESAAGVETAPPDTQVPELGPPASDPESPPMTPVEDDTNSAEAASVCAQRRISVSQNLSSENANSTSETVFDAELPVPARKHGGALPM
ncbi:MAG: DUF3306 domain-containing protein [Rhabdaerophilum sp.]